MTISQNEFESMLGGSAIRGHDLSCHSNPAFHGMGIQAYEYYPLPVPEGFQPEDKSFNIFHTSILVPNPNWENPALTRWVNKLLNRSCRQSDQPKEIPLSVTIWTLREDEIHRVAAIRVREEHHPLNGRFLIIKGCVAEQVPALEGLLNSDKVQPLEKELAEAERNQPAVPHPTIVIC